jgi:hypothetical protein
MKKLVFCSKCRWHKYEQDSCVTCEHESNIRVINTWWCEKHEYKKPCHELNKNNDCKFYSSYSVQYSNPPVDCL